MIDAERKVWSDGVAAIGLRLRRMSTIQGNERAARALVLLAEACDVLPLDAADAAGEAPPVLPEGNPRIVGTL